MEMISRIELRSLFPKYFNTFTFAKKNSIEAYKRDLKKYIRRRKGCFNCGKIHMIIYCFLPIYLYELSYGRALLKVSISIIFFSLYPPKSIISQYLVSQTYSKLSQFFGCVILSNFSVIRQFRH